MNHRIPINPGSRACRAAVLMCASSIILSACAARDTVYGTTPDLDTLTLRSTVLPAGRVRLVDGEYRAPAAPGAASKIVVTLTDKRVFGSLAGKPAGAVIVATTPGGSGTFYELALLARGPEGWVNSDTVLLADRAQVHALSIDAGHIEVRMTVHGPDDPLCCPTVNTTRRFAVQDGHLVADADAPPGSGTQLVDTLWHWRHTQYGNDTRAVPDRPAGYTIRFRGDGTFEAKADCNAKGGAYTLADRQISLRIGHSTMAACAPGSLENQFVRDLAGVAHYFFRGADLYLDIQFDTGTMMFSPAAQ